MLCRSFREASVTKRLYYNAENVSLDVRKYCVKKIPSKSLYFWCTKIHEQEYSFCQSPCSRERVQVNLFELGQPGIVYAVAADDARPFCYALT